MSDFTGYTEEQVAKWMFTGEDMPAAHSSVYVGLHTGDPGNNPDGSSEVSGGDYSRVEVDTANWTVTGDGPTEIENDNEIQFPDATADWGTVAHVSLSDGSTSTDNFLAAYALDNSKTIEENDSARFRAGELEFQID